MFNRVTLSVYKMKEFWKHDEDVYDIVNVFKTAELYNCKCLT